MAKSDPLPEKGSYYVEVKIGQILHHIDENGDIVHTTFAPLVTSFQNIFSEELYNSLIDKDEATIRLIADLVAEALRNADTTGVIREK